MDTMHEAFEQLLDNAVRFHGHLCGGQIMGVRMALAGLRELGVKDPRGREGRDLVIFVESDRCATDAIIAVTGRTPGKRSIKMIDYGKAAATFIETRSGEAVRISVRGDSNEKVRHIAEGYLPGLTEKQATLAALKAIAEEDLFKIQRVAVRLDRQDLPGESLSVERCQMCGEMVRDMRHVRLEARVLCRPCAWRSNYYSLLQAPAKAECAEGRRSDHEPARL